MGTVIKAAWIALRTFGARALSFVAGKLRLLWFQILVLVGIFKDEAKRGAKEVIDHYKGVATDSAVRQALGTNAPSEVIVQALEIAQTNRIGAITFAGKKRLELDGYQRGIDLAMSSGVTNVMQSQTLKDFGIPASVLSNAQVRIDAAFASAIGKLTNGISAQLDKASSATESKFAALQQKLTSNLAAARQRETNQQAGVGTGTAGGAAYPLKHYSSAQIRAMITNIQQGDAMTRWTLEQLRGELVRRENERK